MSSLSGASDVLTALGVKIDVPFEIISRCVAEAGVGFMWAPMHHAAMKHWAPTRAELGIRTIFNLLGPLSNPGGVRRQVVGVFSPHWVEPIAEVLNNLGSVHAWVVHGHDGLDEITTTGATDVTELKDGKVTLFEVTPADAGPDAGEAVRPQGRRRHGQRRRHPRGSGRQEDAAARHRRPQRRGRDRGRRQGCRLLEGAALAARAIESGAAARALDKLIAITNGRD